MKKFLFVLLIIAITSELNADAFKLMGGVNLLKYSATPKEGDIKWSYNLGYCMGGGFEFNLTESNTLAVELDGLLLYRKGSKIESSDSKTTKTNFTLSTVCIPALARLRLKSNFPFYLLGGSEVSLVLSHKADKKTGGSAEQVDLKEESKSFDFGLVLGCGFEIKITNIQSLFVEGRYHLGFVNILKHSDEYESVKNNAMLLIIGIKTY